MDEGKVQKMIFEFFVYMHQKNEKKGWIETTATFTGKYEKAATRTKFGYRQENYNSYEIVYSANDKEQRGWYTFYPLPDPEAEEITGTRMRIQYKKNKPYIFKSLEDEEEE